MPALVHKMPVAGERVADVALVQSTGRATSLSELAKSGFVLVFVYRGGWCAFCLRRLVDFRDRMNAFRKAGVQIAAISMDECAAASVVKQRLKLPFDVLSDSGGTLVSAWNLLSRRDRQAALPATILLDAMLQVRWVSTDDGYSAAQADEVLRQCTLVVAGDQKPGPTKRVFRLPGIMWWIRATRNQLRFGKAKTVRVPADVARDPQVELNPTAAERTSNAA